MTRSVRLLDAEPEFLNGPDGELLIKKQQIITDDMLRSNAEARARRGPEGNFMRVASIPTAVVEKWQREGFDIMTDRNITARQIVARLSAENLGAFITTDKRV